MRHLIKKIIPKPVLLLYHRLLATLATAWYHSPSEKLIVIGVTGTSGKSTTVYVVSQLLEQAGFRVGAVSTIQFKVNKRERINDTKMTMVGRFALQKMLSQMVKANCQYAVIETSSQGIEQFRHHGINYDTVILTNLYPEHIEAHGGFENYKNAKLKLFKTLKSSRRKFIAGKIIPKRIIVNLDNEHAADFLSPESDEKYGFTLTNTSSDVARVIRAEHIATNPTNSEFEVDKVLFRVPMLGKHNVSNALAAIVVGVTEGLQYSSMAKRLEHLKGVPGRLEFINEGQDFTVIVDYAFEPQAMEKLYAVVEKLKPKHIIHVLGGTGGGRDKARRPILGKLAGQKANYVVVTNEDPYDEDPLEIIDQVALGAKEAGKVFNETLFIIPERQAAIAKALKLAGPGDAVLITGKGSEQAIVVKGGKKIPFDDRAVVREELEKL